MGTLATFTLCVVTSEITEIVDAEAEIGLLILTGTKRRELTTQMTVTGTGTETLRTWKHWTNDLWIDLGLQNLCFFKKWTFFLVEILMLVFDSGGNDFSIFFSWNGVDLDVSHDEVKLNNEVENFW